MITNIFDSANFSEITPWYSKEDERKNEVESNKFSAKARLLSHIIFNEEPLQLTGPQLIDGYFAIEDNGRTLFALMEKGLIQISLYQSPASKSIKTIWDYVIPFVLKKENFNYSSKPHLMKALSLPDNSVARFAYNDFTKKLVRKLSNETSVGGYLLDGSLISKELLELDEFLMQLKEKVEKCRDNLYNISTISMPSFSTFFSYSLPNDPYTHALLNLLYSPEPKNKEAFLQRLYQCQNRSEIDFFLFSQRDYMDENVIINTQKVVNLIYNKYSLMPFKKVEVDFDIDGFQQSFQQDYIAQVLATTMDGFQIPSLTHTGIKTLYKTNPSAKNNLDGIMTVENALEIRENIFHIKKENNISWEHAAKRYFNSLKINIGITYNDSGSYTIEFDEATQKVSHSPSADIMKQAEYLSLMNVYYEYSSQK